MCVVYYRSEHLPVAVAARSLERAQEFAKKHDISKAYGSYDALASDPDVEIAYIGVTAPQHLDVVKLMLNAGKHVLCEKPLATSLDQVKEMVQLAQEKNLFFMEAIWSRTFPIYDKLRNVVANDIGEVYFTYQCLVNFKEKSNFQGTLKTDWPRLSGRQ